MKRSPLLLLFLSLIYLLSGCFTSRDYVVESDYSYQSNFRRYKTYNFVMDTNPDELTGQYREVIDEAIRFRMRLLGYKFNANRPDLLIAYRVFKDDFKFKGYSQPSLSSYIRQVDTTRKDYVTVNYQLKNGTLLIQFIDRRYKGTVWQGYTSGVQANPFSKDDRSLRNAVISIFDEYRVFASGTRRPNKASD